MKVFDNDYSLSLLSDIYKHSGNYEQAIDYGSRALQLYETTLGQHPFTASTMHFIAEIYRLNHDPKKSSKFSLLAKSLSNAVSGHHLDTARFIQGYVAFYTFTLYKGFCARL